MIYRTLTIVFLLYFKLLYFTDEGKVADLYVTDYTANTLASTWLPDKLFKAVQGVPVFKIAVFGERPIVKELERGAFYAFRNVHVTPDKSGYLVGKMGGAEVVIEKVRSKSPATPQVTELLQYV